MYGVCAAAAGAASSAVPPGPDFTFPVDEVLAAITAAHALVFMTNPNNPTGEPIPRDDIARVAAAVPEALVFVDEAYHDFCGDTVIADAGDAAMSSSAARSPRRTGWPACGSAR